MAPVEGVGDPEDRCQFGNTHPVVGREVAEIRVTWAWARFSVVSGDECDECDIFLGESKNFAVANDVVGVFLVGSGADKITTFMCDGGASEE